MFSLKNVDTLFRFLLKCGPADLGHCCIRDDKKTSKSLRFGDVYLHQTKVKQKSKNSKKLKEKKFEKSDRKAKIF